MRRVWLGTARVAAGLLVAAMYATPQGTISAKPGAVNYIEGNAFLNGTQISGKSTQSVFLNANDTLSTDLGKAEVLLTPGVFLRIGDNSQVRMVSPSLTDAQVEVLKGEAMLEAAGLLKGNSVRLLSHGATITIQKNGLYRVSADDPPSVAVIDGKVSVAFETKKVDLKKGKQAILSAELKPEKFDSKKADELYAWSNVRSAYEAAASYQSARTVSAAGGNLASLGYTGGPSGPGWMWNAAFNSWAWLPHNGAFYSPFGYGFYAPGMVGYAPVVVGPVYGGGRMVGGHWNHPTGPRNVPVPVSPNNPAAVGTVAQSPWQYRHAQNAARSLADPGFQGGAGAPAGSFEGHHRNWSGPNGTPGANNAGHPGWSGQGHPGGWSGQGHPGGWSGQGHPGGWSGQGHPGGWSGQGHPGGWSGQGHPGAAAGGGHPGGGGGGAPRTR
jgi:FecR protein